MTKKNIVTSVKGRFLNIARAEGKRMEKRAIYWYSPVYIYGGNTDYAFRNTTGSSNQKRGL